MFFLHTEQRGEEGEESYENPDQTPPTGKEAEILAHMWGGALYTYVQGFGSAFFYADPNPAFSKFF